jgi:hypothetical protein
MILEAFSHILKQETQNTQALKAVELLHQWLEAQLTGPEPEAYDPVRAVITTELERKTLGRVVVFEAKTPTGARLLKTLYGYCQAFEDWQYRRWLHHRQASDFGEAFPELTASAWTEEERDTQTTEEPTEGD